MPATRSHGGLSTPGEPGLRAAWPRSGAVRTGPAPERRGLEAARDEPEEPEGHGEDKRGGTRGPSLRKAQGCKRRLGRIRKGSGSSAKCKEKV